MNSKACHCNRILSGLAVLVAAVAAGVPAAAVGDLDRRPAPAAFTTKLGTFTPQPWSSLSGWSGEAHAEALEVFRQTCRSLQRRDTWRGTCAAAQTPGNDPQAARSFFESQFVPYLVSPIEQGKEGLMTGYFEPILEGSPVRKGSFVVPVYGVPPDLLVLDARRWQGVPTDGSVRATLAGDQVVPVAARGPQDAVPESGFRIDPAVFDSDPLDRRYRVRREADRIVPYWTRQQIEAGAATGAPVIAWVDDPQALYLMQVQGSGQVRMPGGRTIRLSYAEQNGHPFRPRGLVATASRTRSIGGTGGGDAEPVAVATPISMRTLAMVGGDAPSKGSGRKKPASGAGASAKSASAADAGASVQGGPPDANAAPSRVAQAEPAPAPARAAPPAKVPAPEKSTVPDKVAAPDQRAAPAKAEAPERVAAPEGAERPGRLAAADGATGAASSGARAPAATAAPAASAAPAAPADTARPRPVHDVERIVDALLAQPSPRTATGARASRSNADAAGSHRDRDARVAQNLSYLIAAHKNDPSYVFFQTAPTGGSGPVGALGVPLTATRSIAVDPRSTPLGSPVFIEADRDDASGPMRRLMIAQDTGGAIRGAVRADFFWGTGPKAGAEAVKTRDDLAMWVLLPRNFARPKASASRTRGIGGVVPAECVMPDTDYCPE